MKYFLILLPAVCFSACGVFQKTPTKRLASDTTVVLYRNYVHSYSDGSSMYIYLPKHYEVNKYDGPDFTTYYYEFGSKDSADGYIGWAGEYQGFAAQKTYAEGDETFEAAISDTLSNGRIREWNLYSSPKLWSLKTWDRLNGWAYGPTKRSTLLWLDILKTTVAEP